MKKKKIKRILEIFLLVLLLGAVTFAVIKIANNDKKTVSSFGYSVGEIDESTGQYVESDKALYMKDPIECRGLSIVPDFESNVEYQIFWYGIGDRYFECTKRYSNTDTFSSADVPEMAKYARIVIYPLDAGIDTDFKIRFYEKSAYANDIVVKVDKKQDFKLENLYLTAKKHISNVPVKPDLNEVSDVKLVYPASINGNAFMSSYDSFTFSTPVNRGVIILNCSGTKYYEISCKNFPEEIYPVYFFNGTKLVGTEYLNHSEINKSVKVPNGAQYMVINIPYTDSGRPIPFTINAVLPNNEITKELYK